jgi:hypothetical protein
MSLSFFEAMARTPKAPCERCFHAGRCAKLRLACEDFVTYVYFGEPREGSVSPRKRYLSPGERVPLRGHWNEVFRQEEQGEPGGVLVRLPR